MGTMKSMDFNRIPYKHHAVKLLYFAHPRTASHATAQALIEQAGFTGDGKWHHKSLYRVPDGWSAITVVRNHFDAIASWHEFKPWRVRPLDIAFVDHLIAEHPYYFPVPDRMWELHRPVSRFVLRYERLELELNQVLVAYGLVPIQIGPANVTKTRGGRPYQDYFDNETREYIERRFAVEMAELGYEWEEKDGD